MTLTIDGRPVTFEGRTTLLDVARANGIFVPSLCDHPGLEPFGACRLCLVEIRGRNRFVPACSTFAEEGLDVRTSTPELIAMRRAVLELILSEHPHACLICSEKSSCDELKSTIRKTDEVTGCVLCPANGRCELQRVAAGMGVDLVDLPSQRRPGEVRRDDPFIDRDNSLCILCGRCVRVCREVRGASVLTFVSRGSTSVIGTALDRRLLDSGCQFCGACVDVCPTGSLAERAVRYDRLPDEERTIICPLCGQGCGLKTRMREGRISGTVPDPDGRVNRGQACVRGRFLVRPALTHPRRLLQPLIRENGSLREAGWEEALSLAAARLSALGPGEVAVTGSSQSACEDLFALHKFAEALGAPAVSGPWAGSAAAALRALGRTAGREVPLNFLMSDIGLARNIVVIGEDLPVAQPMVWLEVHRAVTKGAALVRIDPGMDAGKLARRLDASAPPLFLFGPGLVSGKRGLGPLAALWNLALKTGGRLVPLDREANARGALEVAGAFAARPAPSARRALYIAGPYPKLKPGAAELVIVQASYSGESTEAADIVLPEATTFEAEGILVNIEGRVQLSAAVVAPLGQARPGWWILASLAGKLGAPGFEFTSAAEVRAGLAAAAPAFRATGPEAAPEGDKFLVEGPAGTAAAVDMAAFEGRLDGWPCVAPRDVDDYKGLDLALENKSLKLLRGRR